MSSHTSASGCHSGVVCWARRVKARGNPVGLWSLLSLLSPQSLESPPLPRLRTGKREAEGLHSWTAQPPLPPAGSLPPLSKSISHSLPGPQKLQLVGWGKISGHLASLPALEEEISQEKQASGFHGAVNKQSIPEAEAGRQPAGPASPLHPH